MDSGIDIRCTICEVLNNSHVLHTATHAYLYEDVHMCTHANTKNQCAQRRPKIGQGIEGCKEAEVCGCVMGTNHVHD